MEHILNFNFTDSKQGPYTIYVKPEQIRTENASLHRIPQNAVIRLAASIRKYGVLEPLTVASSDNSRTEPPQYTLISGFKRLAAAKLAKIDLLPCLVIPNSDRACASSAILQKIKGADLHFFEQATTFQMLMQDFKMTQEEIARGIGISQSAVANKLRLLSFTKEEQLKIINFRLTERHARALLRLKSPAERNSVLQRIHAEALSVSAAEQLIEELHSTRKPAIERSPAPITRIEMAKPAPTSDFVPRKFAIQSPEPLYNSIERLVNIFRKTGAEAACFREEGEKQIRTVIEIPQKAP